MARAEFALRDIENGNLLNGLADGRLERLGRAFRVMLWINDARCTIEGREQAVQRTKTALTRIARDLAAGARADEALIDAAIRFAQHDREAFVRANLRSPNHPPPALRPIGRSGALAAACQPRSEGQARYLQMLDRYEIVVAVGPAGTGKTWIALAVGLARLERGQASRLVVVRPCFGPADRDLWPVCETVREIAGERRYERLMHDRLLEVAPLVAMRGRTLTGAYVIFDEAQNATEVQAKMMLTRIGEGSRLVVAGDPTQSDLPAGVPSGLDKAMRVAELVPGAALCRFEEHDIVRHPILAGILRVWDGA